MTEIRCPKCGSTSYTIKCCVSTALAAPEVYIDGKLLPSRDPNYYTSQCSCLNCGANFTSTAHYDNIDNQLDSYQPDVEVIVDAARKAFVASAEEMRKYEIQRLKERIATLQQELQELEMKDGFLSSVGLKSDTYKTGATCGE